MTAHEEITSQDTKTFTGEACGLLAEVIHDVTGWELACFWAGRPCGHAFVKIPDGRYLDITGVHTHREMLDSHWGRPGRHHGRRGITTAHYTSPLVLSSRRAELEARARQLVPAVLALAAAGHEIYEDPDPELDESGHPVSHPAPPFQPELDHPEPIGWW